MLKKLTWKDLLNFLQELESSGKLPTEEDVMWHNLETGDESPCDTVYIQESPSSTSFNRLVLATNWDIVKEKYK
jgi:hypothetical protein